MKRDGVGHLIGLATELGLSMGLTAAGMVVLGLLAGRWLDARLGTEPIATLILVIAGAVAGQLAAFRLVRRAVQRMSDRSGRVFCAKEVLAALGLALRALALIALPSLLGAAAGLYADRRLGTGITITLVLILAGLVAGLVGALRLTQARRERFDERGDSSCSPSGD